MKSCSYRHCNNDLEPKQGRKDRVFCCRKCKDLEHTYLKRKKILLEKYKELELKKVELIKYIKSL